MMAMERNQNVKRTEVDRKASRRMLKLASLREARDWWEEYGKRVNFTEGQAEINRIDKQIRKLEKITPSWTWHQDASRLKPGRGGAFPPPAENTPMVKARGEWRLYPMVYLTNSGHSYDILLQWFYIGTIQQLLDDGYLGSTIRIHELTRQERHKMHEIEADPKRRGKGRMITNVF